MGMNIIVLLSIVLEANQQLMIENGKIQHTNLKESVNPPDEAALEEALLLKEAYGGSVTVLTVHHREAEKHLRRALAMGADNAIFVKTDEDLEPAVIAKLIAEQLSSLPYDLILAGDFSTNGGSGQVGPRVATILGLPFLSKAAKLEVEKEAVFITKESNGDLETYKGKFPVLLTIPQGLHTPRLPKLSSIMKAKQKPLEKKTAAYQNQKDIQTVDFSYFVNDRKKILLEGELEDKVKQLAQIIQSHIQE